jgi:pantoate--beta-alanine ligase
VIVTRSVAETRETLTGLDDVGLVPTMGAYHAGHLSLFHAAREECRTVVASLFVNPTQFGDAADLARYPRDEARDAAAAEEAGVDVLFAPAVEELYPPGYETWVEVEEASRGLEGRQRPGHFRAVATICLKLFNIVRPRRAYFGQKDAQQVMVIRRMALDLAIPTEVIACPTVREADGLALSSRNVHLSGEERAAAPVLRRALLAGRGRWEAGERSAEAIRDAMRAELAKEPLASPNYVSVADGMTLAELERVPDAGPALLSLAVRFGATRLIDNEPLG